MKRLTAVPAKAGGYSLSSLEPLTNVFHARRAVIDLGSGAEVVEQLACLLITVGDLRCKGFENDLFDLARDRAAHLPRRE